MQNVKAGRAEINGANLSFELTGEGPTLVLAHAGVADLTMWNDQLDALTSHYRVLRYDMRGFGTSSEATGAFSHHEDLHGLLEHLGIEKAHFIGLSNGGMVVTDFALTYPERVRSLVLASPALSGYEPSGEPPAAIYELFGALGEGNLEGAAEVATRIWADGPFRTPDDVDKNVRERLNAMSRTALKNHLPDAVQPEGLEPPALGRLWEISVPTLVIVGDKDDPSILDIGDVLVSGIAGAENVVVPGTAHILNMEQPEVFNKTVLDFLERVPREH
jgi:pimeloyl-ACP methyl ester carboxylesterase